MRWSLQRAAGGGPVLDGSDSDYAFCDMAKPDRRKKSGIGCSLAASGHPEIAALFDFLDDVQFWIKDVEGRYVRANRALLANYGFTSDADILGRTDRELFPPHLADQYQLDDRRVLAGAEIRNRIELVGRPDHSTGWHRTDKLPLRAADGRIIGTTGITRDLDAGSEEALPDRELGPVVERIRARYAEPLAKPALARLLGASVRTLERRFAAGFGMSLVAYQRSLRMHQACHLLVSGDDTVTEIALALGYADHSHFTREFRRMFAVPPRTYRLRWTRRPGVHLPITVASPGLGGR